MNGITARCVSLGRGDKDPFERVNYEFGLVLGVDEFVAEQYYFLEKEYLSLIHISEPTRPRRIS